MLKYVWTYSILFSSVQSYERQAMEASQPILSMRKDQADYKNDIAFVCSFIQKRIDNRFYSVRCIFMNAGLSP